MTLAVPPDGLLEAVDPAGDGPGDSGEFLLWQLADSAFPSGGFAHSGGLEAAWQHGEVRGRTDLQRFAEGMLRQLGHAGLPLVLAGRQQPERLSELDRLCEAFTSNHVANRASRLQGQALLASAERIFQVPVLSALRQTGPPFGHLAPVFGAVFGVLGIGRGITAQSYFFQHLRGVLTAAVRLGIVGPLEAQSLQHRLAPFAQRVRADCEHRSVDDLAQTAPWFDLWQGAQDRLYSRLFQS